MHTKRKALAAAIAAGLGAAASSTTFAGVALPDGLYEMLINPTPVIYTEEFLPQPNIGTDSAWNSSFTIGCVPGSKGCGSQAMYDDTASAPVNGKYSGIPNDNYAGRISLSVSGGTITGGSSGYWWDTIMDTAGGDFAQYTDTNLQPVNFSGAVDAAGNMTLTPTGRLATFGLFPQLVDERWNVDNFNGAAGTAANPPTSNTNWQAFSTIAAGNDAGTIHGAQVTQVGQEYRAILVSAGRYGSDWGGFFGAPYFEAWNVTFVPAVFSPVPIPAAGWLFVSGLAGLLGLRRLSPG